MWPIADLVSMRAPRRCSQGVQRSIATNACKCQRHSPFGFKSFAVVCCVPAACSMPPKAAGHSGGGHGWNELYKSNGGNSWTHVGFTSEDSPLNGAGGLFSAADFQAKCF